MSTPDKLIELLCEVARVNPDHYVDGLTDDGFERIKAFFTAPGPSEQAGENGPLDAHGFPIVRHVSTAPAATGTPTPMVDDLAKNLTESGAPATVWAEQMMTKGRQLETELNEANNGRRDFMTEAIQWSEQCAMLRDKLAEAKAEVHKWQSNAVTLAHDSNTLHSQVAALTAERDGLRARVEHGSREYTELRGLYRQTCETIDSLRAQLLAAQKDGERAWELLDSLERVKDLWLPTTATEEHVEEARVLHGFRNEFLALRAARNPQPPSP